MVALVAASEVHIVIKNEFIDGCDHVKVAFPRCVIRLDERNLFHRYVSLRSFLQ